MRVGVFFQEFEPYHLGKDPGQLVVGLNEIGVTTELVSLRKQSLINYSELPIRAILPNEAHDIAYWRGSGFDVILAYTWLRPHCLWIPHILAAAGLPVIVKGDTDGRLNYPLHPMWDTYVGGLPGILSYLKIARRRMKRQLNVHQSIKDFVAHLEIASGAVVETPQALSNLAFTLATHDSSRLLEKIFVIPNPVISSVFSSASKARQIVAVGNWEMKFGDYYAKNTEVMCGSIGRFLIERPDFNAILIGNGTAFLTKLLSDLPTEVLNRIRIVGAIAHKAVLHLLGESRILFMPSISESFGIAASEALTLGCSLVGSPLESLQYMSQGGACGTLASNFSEDAYLGALLADALRWERGDYDPATIAKYWRNELDRKRIAGEFLSLFHEVQSSRR